MDRSEELERAVSELVSEMTRGMPHGHDYADLIIAAGRFRKSIATYREATENKRKDR